MSNTEEQKEAELRILDLSNKEILERAASIVWVRNLQGEHLKGPEYIKQFLEYKMAKHDREVFGVILFGHGHRVISYEELFFGTVDKVTAYCRPIVESALRQKAVSIALVHSHPFKHSKPSQHDIDLTVKVKEVLAPLDIALVDHYIVGTDFLSMRFQGFKELFV